LDGDPGSNHSIFRLPFIALHLLVSPESGASQFQLEETFGVISSNSPFADKENKAQEIHVPKVTPLNGECET